MTQGVEPMTTLNANDANRIADQCNADDSESVYIPVPVPNGFAVFVYDRADMLLLGVL